MIISSSPCRISLGSCDHSPYSENFGGLALNFSINKRVYIIIRKRNPLDEFQYRVSYSRTELKHTIDEIEHPLVREALKMSKIEEPLEIIYTADMPAKVGLATSSAMTIALLKGLKMYQNIGISNEILFDLSYKLERDRVGEPGGWQDYATCYGGMQLLRGQKYKVKRTAISLEPDIAQDLKEHLLLLYTGRQEASGEVLKEQLKRLKKGETLEETRKIKQLIEEMYALLIQPDFEPMQLAPVMKEAWEMKKKLSSSMSSDQIVAVEKKLNRICPDAGYRLVGSGGGRGFLLVLAPPGFHEIISRAVGLQTFDFDFDYDGAKATIINSHNHKRF